MSILTILFMEGDGSDGSKTQRQGGRPTNLRGLVLGSKGVGT